MHPLVAALIPILIILVICYVIIILVRKFSPDPTFTQIATVVVYAVALIAILTKLLPLITF